MKTKYKIIKNKQLILIKSIDYNKLKGFQVKPKRNIEQGIQINKMVLINKSFIKKIIEKKNKIKLEHYLKYIISLIENEEEDGTSLKIALNDLEKYKRTIINTYRLYLESKYIELLLKKIEVYEHELRKKIVFHEMYSQEKELENTKEVKEEINKPEFKQIEQEEVVIEERKRSR